MMFLHEYIYVSSSVIKETNGGHVLSRKVEKQKQNKKQKKKQKQKQNKKKNKNKKNTNKKYYNRNINTKFSKEKYNYPNSTILPFTTPNFMSSAIRCVTI